MHASYAACIFSGMQMQTFRVQLAISPMNMRLKNSVFSSCFVCRLHKKGPGCSGEKRFLFFPYQRTALNNGHMFFGSLESIKKKQYLICIRDPNSRTLCCTYYVIVITYWKLCKTIGQVSALYRDASIGNAINIVMVRLMLLENESLEVSQKWK